MKRRQFIQTASLAAAATLQSCSLLEKPVRTGRIIEGRKINIACVGVGGMGAGDVRESSHENIVALCDVDFKRAEGSFNRHPQARRYRDYRVMLREMDEQIDAVVVSTADHMHFPIAMMAIEMGKHVMVQKPLAHTIEEVRLLTEAARKHQVQTQMRIQGHAMSGIRRMREWYALRAIGEIEEIHIWTDRPIWPQGVVEPLPAEEVPETMDWNLWLGVAPVREYNAGYAPFSWRGWWDFGCGALGDIGCHAFDCAFDVLKLGSPTSVEATSDVILAETGPHWSIVTYEFPANEERGPVKLVWHDGGKQPERPKELEPGKNIPGGIGGQLWYGSEGTIMVNDVYCASARIIPEVKMQEFVKTKQPQRTEKKSPGIFQEWFEACKGGERAGAHFDFSGPLTEMVLLGNLAVRMGQKIEWDAKRMRCTNVPAANQYVSKQYRTF